ncbi:MAG: hypothetical protein A3J25_10525 [Pseudomonadales bacterium RIFCSPLOWO2_02_FULL_63_210]|nr:MAG: hypothetical protein A3J25_10525 [Pseudomonadales bacterium RIFCSPLOWO2_02_FULL_63_210]
MNGEPTTGWAAVNLQLVRRLGESGTLSVNVREQGSTAASPRQIVLKDWLRGVEEPNPIAALGIRPWRPALLPVLAQLDPKGPAQAAGLRVGDRLLMLNGEPLDEWQQLVDRVQAMPGEPIRLVVERDGQELQVA